MIHNGVELQGMTHNGVEVQTWTHNGVEVYSGSEPWVAISSTGELTAPCVKPVLLSGTNPIYWQGAQVGYETYGSGGIVTKNEDGSNYLPTKHCKFLKCRLSIQKGGEWNYFDIVGKKRDGSETVIFSTRIAAETSVELQYYRYQDFSDIDIRGYESIKITARNSSFAYPGIAYIEFYN